MKKVIKLFVFALGLFAILCTNTYALNATEAEVVERIKATETKVEETVAILTNWSNSYAASLKTLFNRNFVNQLDSVDIAKNIDIVINELNSNGNVAAANALSLIKSDLINNYAYIKESLNMTEDYLLKNSSGGVAESLDLFIQIRESAKNLKPCLVDLANIYYELDYSDIRQKIAKYDTASEIVELCDYILNKLSTMEDIFVKLETKLVLWQDIYNMYYLSDYNSLFMEYFGDYYEKVRVEYNNLYTELETKLQNKLDSKIDVIVDETDVADYASVMTRNTKLYDIMSYISDVKNETITVFEEANLLIKIEAIAKRVNNQQKRILNRLDEAIAYTESYILDYEKLMTKIKEDEKYIDTDHDNGIIIYNQTELDANKFVDRLISSLGDIKVTNVYGGKIGTLSKIQLHYNTIVIGDYTIIVKGDIAPNGVFDITDIVKLCNKMFEKEELSEYLTIAADMNNDSKIDITDVVLLCNILFNK